MINLQSKENKNNLFVFKQESEFGSNNRNTKIISKVFLYGKKNRETLNILKWRVAGIEPASSPWQGGILPLDHTRFPKKND